LVQTFEIPECQILISDDVKNTPQLRIGLINEIMSEAILTGWITLFGNSSAGPQFCSYVEMIHFSGTP
jgi:hypothetical protein